MSRSIATITSETVLLQRLRLHGPAAICGAYIVLYVALDWLSYIQPVLKLGITPWNPQAGLTLAFLLVRGPEWAPATAVAALASEYLVRGGPAPWPALAAASSWIACGYAVLASVLRRSGMAWPVESTEAAARLAIGAALTTLSVAAGYIGVLVAAGALPGGAIGGGIARYWVGDLNGVLTLTPLLLVADRGRRLWRAVGDRGALIAAQFGAVVLAMAVIFGLPVSDQLRLFYPLFVPVIWITLKWGIPGAMLSALTVQIGLIIAVQVESAAPALVDLQFLMLTLSLTALLLGAVVTERANALEEVARREGEQRVLLTTAPDAVLTVDSVGKIQSANPAALSTFGLPVSAQGSRLLREILPAVQLQSEQGRANLEGLGADGGTFPAEIAWARLGVQADTEYLVIVRDTSERQRAEQQLREREVALARAMRFAVAGELASALAHELNQPITALVSYLQAAEILSEPLSSRDERLLSTLGKARHEAIRASEVLRRLRDFYRGASVKHQRLELTAFITACVATFNERVRRAGAELLVDIPADLPDVDADATQLEIVFHNLLSNAIEAISQQSPALRHIVVSASHSPTNITIQVEDSGYGVAPEIAEKLFEPFMTSKVDGMGLGLAISRSLLRSHGGDLSHVPSAGSGGACFIVRLPRRQPSS